MARIVDFAAPLGQKAGPGQWNDLDMREPLPRNLSTRSHVGVHSSDRVEITSLLPTPTMPLTLAQKRWNDV
jgi:hypothetical protein